MAIESKNDALNVHNRIKCDNCKTEPIIGARYKCLSCYNYDLCEKCETLFATGNGTIHDRTHIFAKIITPVLDWNPSLMLSPYFDPKSLASDAKFNGKHIVCKDCSTSPGPFFPSTGACISCKREVLNSSMKYCDTCSCNLYSCRMCGKSAKASASGKRKARADPDPSLMKN